ncbi:uncharacterized protein EV420DRAFT_1114308 [Desarmillaria tabescens]|uniref:LIM zinc-binding domain-containing protein n=1 Tax=Armillaria tabescens TaxID=1929756 RepID=A0AA39NE92_ARMTA|nr:uncharacterized protein EV420DRAFT_1114308 [Desarmillaria tabescens]KAK0463909.1 hypothetical protein EV420DRAFT_1114308 [Desarmillaria tabescens]
MMASLLTPTPANPPGRISQLLPTVKCSNCHQPVPLAELGEHICTKPPPLPPVPKPASPVPSVTSGLSQRLQNLVSSPKPNNIPLSPSRPSPPTQQRPTSRSAPQRPTPPPQHRPTPSTASDHIRVRTTSGPSSTPSRSSPLARPGPDRRDTASPAARRDLYVPSTASPLRSRTPSSDFRTRTVSSSSSSSSPSTARPSFISTRDSPSPQPQSSPKSVSPQPVAPYVVPQIDTKIGGEAGMAGVGRRGFAAAAHAAVFLSSQPPRESRRDNAPQFLDIAAALSSNATPPLSPSGYSSTSPGPVSPLSQFHSPILSSKPPSPTALNDSDASPVSPLGIRLPFPDKLRKSVTPIDTNSIPIPNTPSTATSHTRSRTSSSASRSHTPARSVSRSTTASRRDDHIPTSPSSGSEYGLAYADSTDYEEDDRDTDINTKTKANPPPPLPLTTSILRSTSQTSQQSHIRFPSASDHGRSTKQPSPAHQKSSGSVSSVSDADAAAGIGRDRSNSSLIAQALGLSQTPPSNYGRLGGPPSRSGRSASGSSSGSRSAYSRSTSVSSGTGLGIIAQSSSGLTTGKLERAMETLLEDVALDDARSSLSKSKSTGKQTYFKKEDGSDARTSTVPIPYRSNTMQVVSSPENKPVKLPARARTEKERSSDLERVRKGKEALRGIERPAKKVRICVRCDKKIEDGRWVQVDTGGVLCEQCWKNMYLPKCRRCNLPIEKQAVSSSDGQLKGKYHKDCFNCHICHKSFPDKTFYVFDGRPLCAYHYHEANDSLCAAATCGQPIEGPCAVSHAGDRYHPEHLLCEHSGCHEKLEEYWEVDGRMLCERHARHEDDVDDYAAIKSMRRVTRFIDLAGASELGLR